MTHTVDSSPLSRGARLAALAALAALAFAGTAEAQAGNCFPACRTGYACSPSNECVSICNPPCGEGQLCTAEASCIDDPSAAQAIPVQPAQPQYVQPVQQPRHDSQGELFGADAGPSLLARPGSFRISAAFHLGFGGEASTHFDGEELGAGDLSTTLGVHARGLFAIGDYFLLGPAFSYRSYIPDVPDGFEDPDRVGFIGVGAAFGAHYGIDLGSIAVDPYFLVGLGLAVALADENLGIEDPEFGVDFSIRAGADVWFTETFGATASVGYQRADVFVDFPGASESGRISLGQFALELGLSVRMGG